MTQHESVDQPARLSRTVFGEHTMKVTIKNYRCFDQTRPVEVEFRKGIIAFVGVNNSGKSTILKFFYELRKLWEKASELSSYKTPGDSNQVINIGYADSIDPKSIFCNRNEKGIEVSICLTHSDLVISSSIRFINRIVFCAERSNPNNWVTKFYDNNDSEVKLSELQRQFQGHHPNNDVDFSAASTALNILLNCIYIGTQRLPTGQNGGRSYDLQYGKDFVNLWDSWKNGYNVDQRKIISDAKKDIKSILNLDQLEISGSLNKENLIVEMDGQSLALTEIGDGIGQCIITLGTVAIKKPSFLLIDEPEISLHASLQLDFITSLFSYTEHGLIFTTHSIGLARAAASNSIKTVHFDKVTGHRDVRYFEEMDNLQLFLGELNYSTYRDLGFEKILLVEGPTDIKVFQQFLRKYKIEHKVAILHGGGSSIFRKGVKSELEEIKRISNNNLFIIIDSEQKSEEADADEKRKDFKAICDEMNIHCHLTKRRATENYFTAVAIKKVVGQHAQALSPFDDPKKIEWTKNDNWRIAKEMQLEDLRNTDIGEFIEQNLK